MSRRLVLSGAGVGLALLAVAGVMTLQTSPSTKPSTMDLWARGALAGANVYQRRVFTQDPEEITVQGPVVPRYEQSDFDALAETGANLVVLSHPGPFTEVPPYEPDTAVMNNLDRLVSMADDAGLSAVIALRTGPGRNELSFAPDQAGTWFQASEILETVWTDPEAQAGWAAMWDFTARHFAGNPAVVGYDLLVEPNTTETPDTPDAGAAWNDLAARLADVVRRVDPDTPILLSPDGWASAGLLPVLEPPAVGPLVLNVHLYEPSPFVYEGDGDLDDAIGQMTADLDATVATAQRWGVPAAMLEFGAVPSLGAPAYLAEATRSARERSMSTAVWLWEPESADWPRDPLAVSARTSIPADDRLRALERQWEKAQ
ncbi:MAG: cellulase family glycosylhydrolase [Acidimicrobiales bacterium]